MARMVAINLNGDQQLGVNTTRTVGITGMNKPEDVMLVKTLFNYIANGLGPEAIGLGGEYSMPDMSSAFDNHTHTAITMFQVQNASGLMMRPGFLDSHIHPASYKGRLLNSLKPLMCITLLHIKAYDAGVIQGHGGYYPEQLMRLQPELAQYLDRWD